MKVLAATLATLLLLATCSPSEDGVPSTCCFKYHRTPIPRRLVSSVFITSSSCTNARGSAQGCQGALGDVHGTLEVLLVGLRCHCLSPAPKAGFVPAVWSPRRRRSPQVLDEGKQHIRTIKTSAYYQHYSHAGFISKYLKNDNKIEQQVLPQLHCPTPLVTPPARTWAAPSPDTRHEDTAPQPKFLCHPTLR
uniref:Chemokine interleukin-8-like domain-containing protein n=1 Tax=Corvus moneduloides TaxID=1196302 RepID=A0A8U7N473_CORMO